MTKKPAKAPKPNKTEIVRRARLAGLLLETLLTKDSGALSTSARGKIAEAAKLLADASKSIGRSAAGLKNLPVAKAKRRAKGRK